MITTTYKNTDYETSEALRDAINIELAQLAYPYTVKHKVYGEGQLTFIKAPLMGGNLYATVEFSSGTKTLAMDVVLANQILDMPESLLDILLETQTVFKTDFLERQEAQILAERQARERAAEAKKKAIEDQKAEEKYENTKARAIREFELIKQTERKISTAEEFYYSLGWLTKHLGTVTAALPDYLEDSFTKYFGIESPRHVVDSKKKGPSGYTSQWTWSFSISLKKPEAVPALIAERLNPAGKAITDTSFVWDLVENYGFQFGKTQDIDKIISCIPSDYISSFEAGRA